MTPHSPGDAAPPHPSDRSRSATRLAAQAADVSDLISYIQHTLGFPPTQSLTGITLTGRSLGAVLRCDWDEAVMADDGVHEQYARMFAEHLSRDMRADGSIVILFRDHPHLAAHDLSVHDLPAHDLAAPGPTASGLPAADPVTASDRRLASTLDRELRAAGLDLREMWLVTAGRTWHVDCPRPAHCPDHGAPLSRVDTSVVNATLIVEGSVVSEEPEGSGLPRPAGRHSPEMMAALMQVLDPIWADQPYERDEWHEWHEWHQGDDGDDGACEGPAGWDGLDDPDGDREAEDADALALWLQDWERVLAGDGLPGDVWVRALLAAGLVRVQWRDCLMASASFGRYRAVSGAAWWGSVPRQLADLLEVEPREVNGVLFTSVILGGSRRTPDWERIARLRDACADLIPEAAGPVASALRCLVAWVEWARGRGSVAGRILTESRRDDPDYPLGQLLTQIVDRGLLCGWAGRRETAWSATARRRS